MGESLGDRVVAIAGADEVAAVRAICDRVLSANQRPDLHQAVAALGAAIKDHDEPDFFGEGGVVADLEAQTAELLGTEQALFFPTGIMAQQAALQVWAEHGYGRAVALHHTAHLLTREDDAFDHVSRFATHLLGDPGTTIRAADLLGNDGVPRIVLLELPQRDTGGHLPPLEELVEIRRWARETERVLHLDGARLWEAALAYGVRPADLAGYFDSIYVSFYKALGAVGGAALAGSDAFIEAAKIWRRRMGGTVIALWPHALSARASLRSLEELPAWHAHATAIADAVERTDGMALATPIPTTLLHVVFPVPRAALARAVLATARETGVWLGGYVWSGPTGDSSALELHCFSATLHFSVTEIIQLLMTLRDRAQEC